MTDRGLRSVACCPEAGGAGRWCALGSAPQAQGSKGPSITSSLLRALLLAALPGKATHDGWRAALGLACLALSWRRWWWYARGSAPPSSRVKGALTHLLLLHRSSLQLYLERLHMTDRGLRLGGVLPQAGGAGGGAHGGVH